MESDTIESSSESKFPLIAGIAGVALGVVGLILAVKAKGAADAAAQAAAEARQNAQDAAAAVAAKADGATVNALAADFSSFKDQTAKAFQDATTAYADLRKAVEGGRARSGGGSTTTAGPVPASTSSSRATPSRASPASWGSRSRRCRT